MRGKVLKMAGIFCVFLFFILISKGNSGNVYQLKNVLILTRHNIRTPLSKQLETYSSKHWPVWRGNPGDLTEKGFMLEMFMGKYFKDWLVEEGLLQNDCPKSEDVHIYANTKQRTKETAKAFVKGAFGDCKVNITVKEGMEMDPVFNPVIRNSTQSYKDVILRDMNEKIDEVNLDEPYAILEELIDLNNSRSCKLNSICDLRGKNEIVFMVGQEPNLRGPLEIGNAMVDAYLMAFYNGFDIQELKDKDIFKSLMKINIQNHNVRFNSTAVAKLTSELLIRYMKMVFLDETQPKLTVLVGHDSNLIPVMRAFNVKSYQLPNQIEVTPIGGKLVFQKWFDSANNRDLFKIDFIYQSTDQLRNGEKLTLKNPPKSVNLRLKNCEKTIEDFCLWSDFVNILNNIL